MILVRAGRLGRVPRQAVLVSDGATEREFPGGGSLSCRVDSLWNNDSESSTQDRSAGISEAALLQEQDTDTAHVHHEYVMCTGTAQYVKYSTVMDLTYCAVPVCTISS
jgi:hypothetical protein